MSLLQRQAQRRRLKMLLKLVEKVETKLVPTVDVDAVHIQAGHKQLEADIKASLKAEPTASARDIVPQPEQENLGARTEYTGPAPTKTQHEFHETQDAQQTEKAPGAVPCSITEDGPGATAPLALLDRQTPAASDRIAIIRDQLTGTTTAGNDQPLGTNSSDAHESHRKPADVASLSETHCCGLDARTLDVMALRILDLDAGSHAPERTSDNATVRVLAELRACHASLARMIRAIEGGIGSIRERDYKKRSLRLESPRTNPSTPVKPARKFKGQEEWQTGTAKKTVWNPAADWGSDMAYLELDAKEAKKLEVGDTGGPKSKLRHTFTPDDVFWEKPWQAFDEYEWDVDPGSPWTSDDVDCAEQRACKL